MVKVGNATILIFINISQDDVRQKKNRNTDEQITVIFPSIVKLYYVI